MKHSKSFIVFFCVLFISTVFALNIKYDDLNVYSNEYKTIKTIEIDTTGDKVKEKVKILADEENKGYIVKIIHDKSKIYTLEPDKKFKFLAPYKPFWDLNITIADINNDSVPEIITKGSTTHENPIHIFRWNGTNYEIIFSGFYEGYRFEDITGDDVLEFIIENRLYGTGYERIYYQWKNNKYNKIFYEIDAGRGFGVIQGLVGIMPHDDPFYYSKELLGNYFTYEWINNKKNIEALKRFKKNLFFMQIIDYIDNKIEWEQGVPIKETWKFKVKIYRLNNTTLSSKELIMITKLKQDTTNEGKAIWRIENIEFIE